MVFSAVEQLRSDGVNDKWRLHALWEVYHEKTHTNCIDVYKPNQCF